MDVVGRVRRFIAQHDLAGRDTRVAVALSGGPDSVALLHVVRALAEAGELRAAGVAHFNHQLRESAGRDQQFSARIAESFGWPFVAGTADVRARATREGRSVEDAAHVARHDFFERARVELGADVVALGHTRDDQAETFLLRLLRGAGPKGLAGMHPRHGHIVRPVLCCRRGELREYLTARGADFVTDDTNSDVAIPRNRVRAELLPMLEARFNPGIVEVLADEAALAREVWQWMEEQLTSATWRLQSEEDAAIAQLDVARLRNAPAALRRFAIWKAMSEAASGRPISFDHVEAALDLLGSDADRSIDMPGHTVERLGPRLVLRKGAPGVRGKGRSAPSNFFDYPLSIPGEVPVPQAGCVLAAESCPPGTFDLSVLQANPGMAAVPRDLCRGPWRVRSRRAGDRFRPLGLDGRKTLQDYFVDRKVARERRDAVPLVVDERDRIVWVAGFGIDEAFRVTDPAQAVIMLRLKLLGGPA